MRRALIIIGRFAFCGWALFTGTIVACFLVAAFFEGRANVIDNLLYAALFGFFGGLAGAVGGAVLALAALGLERLKKRPVNGAAAAQEAADTDPAVWPPAPKPPSHLKNE